MITSFTFFLINFDSFFSVQLIFYLFVVSISFLIFLWYTTIFPQVLLARKNVYIYRYEI